MATITSVASGLWSAAGTWDAGVPVDGDDVIISAGHTVTFDVDQSAFVTGVSVVITGVLSHTVNSGNYCLFIKTGASISGAGAWNIGTKAVPIPFASKHLITGVSGWYINGAAGLSFTCYAAEPTIKYVQLTGSEAIGQTVLSIDADLTGITDYWKSGDQVLISELIGTNRQTYTISGISATELTISSGLSSAKNTGAVILLLTRNVVIDCLVPASQTFSNLSTFTDVSIGGGLFKGTSAKSKHCFEQVVKEITLEGGVFYYFNYVSSRRAKLDTVVFADNNRPGHLATGSQNNDVIAVGFDVWYGWEGLVDGLFACGTGGTAFEAWNVQMFNCKLYGATNIFSYSEHYLSNCETYGGVNFSWGGFGAIKYSYIGQSYGLSNLAKQSWVLDNVIFASANPVSKYPEYHWYIASTNHNQIQGNLNAWSKGGKTISQSTVLPSGYSSGYLTVLVNASWEGFWESEVVVSAGASVNIEMSLRKDASMTYLPRSVVFNKASIDPFAGGIGLHTFTMTDSIDTWESDTFTYTNTGSDPVNLVIRYQGMNATGSMYSALDIEQINVDLTSAIALITEVKAKTDQLAFTVPNQVDANALSGGTTPADVADAIWDEVIADHSAPGTFGAKNQKVVPSETLNDYKADVSNLALEATLTAMKGAGWTVETLKSIKDAIAALPAGISTADIMNTVVEGTFTLQDVLRIMASAQAGKLDGGGTGTLTFRDLSDTLDRIIATVDLATGDRDAITLDLT